MPEEPERVSESAESGDPSRSRGESPPQHAAGRPPAWASTLRPQEGPPEPLPDERPPTLAFGAGLGVWAVGVVLLVGRCALPG